jgi:hypothetical protein
VNSKSPWLLCILKNRIQNFSAAANCFFICGLFRLDFPEFNSQFYGIIALQ